MLILLSIFVFIQFLGNKILIYLKLQKKEDKNKDKVVRKGKDRAYELGRIGEEGVELKLGLIQKKKSTQHNINVVYSCTRNNVG